ncbi:MAG: efflux RND transporter periplasmic adaptor subunit [Desulfobacterales bacterium]
MKNRVKLFLLLVIVAVGALGIWWWNNAQTGPSDPVLTLYGNIEIRDVHLSFTEPERISRIWVEEGDYVEEGQSIARLEADQLKAETAEADARFNAQKQVVMRLINGTRPEIIAQLQAEVEAARAMYTNAKQNFERIQATSLGGATPRQKLDDARAAFEIQEAQLHVKEKALDLARKGPRHEEIEEAKARLQAMKAHLELLRIRLEKRTLKAPSPGIIQSRILEAGEMAGPGRPVVTLALIDPKWVRAYIPEPNLGHIRTGMAAAVYSDTFPEEAFPGRIGFISPVAEFTPKNVETEELRTKLVYEVRIIIQDPQNRFPLGMPVTVKIPIPRSRDSSSEAIIHQKKALH